MPGIRTQGMMTVKTDIVGVQNSLSSFVGPSDESRSLKDPKQLIRRYFGAMMSSFKFTAFLSPIFESVRGLVAQWITRLTTDQKIPGSNPGKVVLF